MKLKEKYPFILIADAMIAAAEYLARDIFPLSTILNREIL
jgi:hypothetical protein